MAYRETEPEKRARVEADNVRMAKHAAEQLREIADRLDAEAIPERPLKLVMVSVVSDQLKVTDGGYAVPWPIPDGPFTLTIQCWHPTTPAEKSHDAQ